MKLFRIEILDYSNCGGIIQHKVFLNDTEELKYRRSTDELIQKQLVKSYKMHELHINNIEDISTLKNLSLSDLKKLILYKDEGHKNVENINKQNQENEDNKVNILDELRKVKKDDNTIYRYNGYNSFPVLNELIISKQIDKIYLSKQAVIDIIKNSTDIKMDTDTLLRYCQISETTSNKDIADLWYSINCGFNFSNRKYYVYGLKVPFIIDDRLHEYSVIGFNNNKVTVLYNVSNEYLDILKKGEL